MGWVGRLPFRFVFGLEEVGFARGEVAGAEGGEAGGAVGGGLRR